MNVLKIDPITYKNPLQREIRESFGFEIIDA